MEMRLEQNYKHCRSEIQNISTEIKKATCNWSADDTNWKKERDLDNSILTHVFLSLQYYVVESTKDLQNEILKDCEDIKEQIIQGVLDYQK